MLGLSNIRCLQWLIVVLLLVTVELNPTGKATIEWTPPTDAEWCMVRYRFLDKTPNPYTEAVRADANSVQAMRPRSGHWAAEVQACKKDTDGSDLCSTWTKSDIDGVPEPWIIYWKPPPTTGIKVEDINGTQ